MGLRRTHAESRGAQAPHNVDSQGVFLTSVEIVTNWTVTNSQWPVTMGLVCYAVETMPFRTPRFDAAHFSMEVFHAPPRQTDLMIISGRVNHKMTPVMHNIYDKMTNPKWVISMSVCTSSGGMFNNYAIVQGYDHVVSVGIYLPDYPPRPEMLISAMSKLRGYAKRNRRLTKDAREAATRTAKKTALAAPDTHAVKGLLV